MHPLALNQKTAKLRNAVFLRKRQADFALPFILIFTAQQKNKAYYKRLAVPPRAPPCFSARFGVPAPHRLAPILWRQSRAKGRLKPRFCEGGLSKLSALPNAEKSFFRLSASAFCFSLLVFFAVPDCKPSGRVILFRFLNCLSFSLWCLVSSSAQVRFAVLRHVRTVPARTIQARSKARDRLSPQCKLLVAISFLSLCCVSSLRVCPRGAMTIASDRASPFACAFVGGAAPPFAPRCHIVDIESHKAKNKNKSANRLRVCFLCERVSVFFGLPKKRAKLPCKRF